MRGRGSRLGVAGLLAACCALIAVSLTVGAERISLSEAFAAWRAGESSPALTILADLRLPRTLVALIAGAGLAVAGCAFQALLRNPLATPYTLGVASAGAFGAWTAHIVAGHAAGTALGAFNAALAEYGFSLVQIGAFTFAMLDVAIIYWLATRQRRMAPAVLLLTGVTLGMMANAGIMLMRYFASPEKLVAVERWLMGGVDVIGPRPILTLLIGVLPCSAILIAQAAKFDQLGFNPEMAAGRGVNVSRLQAVTFFAGSLMTAVIVSEVGPIGFVGLIVPHTVRLFTGPGHRLLMPVCAIAGGAFLCGCDIAARLLLPHETPIGVITALIGVPVFLALLMRQGFRGWEG